MRHRRIDTPAQKERGSYPGISCKPRLNPNGVVAALDTLGHNSDGVGSHWRGVPRVNVIFYPAHLQRRAFEWFGHRAKVGVQGLPNGLIA